MNQSIVRVFILLIVIILCGCSIRHKRSDDHSVEELGKDTTPLHKLYQIWAMRYAINQEFQKALYYWEIAGKLDPEDQKIPIRADGLKAFLENESERHYIRGIKAKQDNLTNKAKKEFLTALRYNPHNQKVLRILKNMTTQYGFSGYTVKAGDTFKKIAEEVYQDPDLDFLIAYLLDMNPKEKPIAGQIMNLPELDKDLANAPKERVSVARKKKTQIPKKRKGVYQSVGIDNQKRVENKVPIDASNGSLYQKGIILYEERKYLESLAVFSKIDPSYKDVNELISLINTNLVKEAEEHYHKGVKLFIHEKLAEAIKEWEKTLTLNPEHEKANKNIEDARALLKKLEEVD